ncbi:MAG: DinB family protein [Cyclobacteriaceae bacterium]
MATTKWFEREFEFGLKPGMLPFFIERLSFTALRVEQKVRGIGDKMLSVKLDGKWSIKQNIGHLAEVDEIAMKRIHEMLSGTPILSPAVFEPKQDYNLQPVGEVIAYFDSNRKKNIALYDSLSDIDLTKSSQHPRLKVMMNPVDLALFDADHDDHHLVGINEILNTLNK